MDNLKIGRSGQGLGLVKKMRFVRLTGHNERKLNQKIL